MEDIIVLLCVVRLLDVDTDLLISLNIPVKSAENRIDLNSNLNSTPDPGPVQSPEGSEEEDLGSTCIGRGCAYLLIALKGSSVVTSTSTSTSTSRSQPSIGDMLCTEVSTFHA